MSKQTKKQIVEQTRNKIAHTYTSIIKELENRIKELSKNSLDLLIENKHLKNENEQYKEKIAQYEDWVYRLQEFMDMPNELRNEKFNECISKKNADEALNNLIRKFAPYFNLF